MIEFLQWLFVVLYRIYLNTSIYAVFLASLAILTYKFISSRPLTVPTLKRHLTGTSNSEKTSFDGPTLSQIKSPS